MSHDEQSRRASLQHPWVNADGRLAHPDSPAGGGGPGMFRSSRPFGSTIDFDAWLPHAQSPAARTFALTAADVKTLPVAVATPSAGAPAPATKKLTCQGVVAAGGPLNDATIDLINEAVKNQTNKRYIAYEKLVKVGGNLPWRFNNPGNLRYADTQLCTAPGQVGKFSVFATMEDGRAAQKSLYLNTYGSMTVHDAVYKLTPPEDQNNTERYLKALAADGIDLEKDVKSQIDALMTAIEKEEGVKGVGVEVNRLP